MNALVALVFVVFNVDRIFLIWSRGSPIVLEYGNKEDGRFLVEECILRDKGFVNWSRAKSEE